MNLEELLALEKQYALDQEALFRRLARRAKNHAAAIGPIDEEPPEEEEPPQEEEPPEEEEPQPEPPGILKPGFLTFPQLRTEAPIGKAQFEWYNELNKTLTNTHLRGAFDFGGKGLTLKSCIVEIPDVSKWWGGGVMRKDSKLTLRNVKYVAGGRQNSNPDAISSPEGGLEVDADGLEITGAFVDGGKFNKGKIRNAAIYDLTGDGHRDGFQIMGGADIEFRNVFIDLHRGKGPDLSRDNAALFFQPFWGATIKRINIINADLRGGYYPLRIEGTTSDVYLEDVIVKGQPLKTIKFYLSNGEVLDVETILRTNRKDFRDYPSRQKALQGIGLDIHGSVTFRETPNPI